jgi:hypothetical protein
MPNVGALLRDELDPPVKIVTWLIRCETLVNTDDAAEAEAQVVSLFENAVWGDREGHELCVSTVQMTQLVGITDAD